MTIGRPRLALAVIALVALAAAGAIGVATVLPGQGSGTRSPDGVGAADGGSAGPGGGPASPRPAPVASPTPVPAPGHEVFGFVPYWEMDATIADHVQAIPLTTLALFSVGVDRSGAVATTATGYRRITGPVGRRLVADAHRRHVRVELVFSSFGTARNDAFLGSEPARARAAAELVALTRRLGLDGIDVDAEGVSVAAMPAYGAFVGRLRDALRARLPRAQVSVATTGSDAGAFMASLAAAAGADRVFLMAYDYHSATTGPGASAPLGRRDGSPDTIEASLERYRLLGVPVERTILGLPLYGVSWPVVGPALGAASTGEGRVFVPRRNLDLLDRIVPVYDPVEGADVLSFEAGGGWRQVWLDTPRSLEPKLALADERGLAGAGFWALGYTRGLPGYARLIAHFHTGALEAGG